MSISYQPSGSGVSSAVWAQVCELGPSSPVTSWDRDNGVTASVSLRVPWAHKLAILDDIIVNRLEYPYITGSKLYASAGSVSPMDGVQALDAPHGNSYDFARLDLTFEPFEITGASDENVFTESIAPSAEYMILDHSNFQWGASGSALQPAEAPGLALRGFDYVQTRYFLSSLPGELLTKNNTCNSTAVVASLLGLTFPIETLLFTDPQATRNISTGGNSLWTLTSKFSFRPTGWNKFWRNETQAWEDIYVKGSPATIFKPVPPTTWGGLLV